MSDASEAAKSVADLAVAARIKDLMAINDAAREPWDDHYRLWMRILGAHK